MAPAIVPFIPPEEAARVAEGSFEQLASMLDEEIGAGSARLFGSARPCRRIATFPKHAIVADAAGRAVRIKFEKDSGGRPRIVSHEVFPLKVVNEETSPSIAAAHASALVAAFAVMDEGEMLRQARQLVRLVEARQDEPGDVALAALEALDRDCPWKRAFEEEQASIYQAISGVLGTLDQQRLAPKFGKLLDGSMPLAEVAGYADLVRSDFAILAGRWQKVAADTRGPEASPVSEDAAEMAFAGFVLDFRADAGQIARVLGECVSRVSDVQAKARIYDAAAKALYRYEAAAEYIAAASTSRR